MDSFLRRTLHLAEKRLRLLANEQGGLTIVEVVVTAAIVVLIAGGTLTGIDAAGRSSADLRHRTQAQELAQADQERLRGMSSLQLSGLNETRQVPLDGTNFEVTSTGQFLDHVGQGTSCGNTSADYVRIVSTVDWQPLNKRPPVVVQSVITPPIGGTMIIKVPDENIDVDGQGVAGAQVEVVGPETYNATTSADGCVVIAGMEAGDYDVTASKTNFVDWDGNTEVSDDAVHVSTSDSAIPLLDPLGQAGAINASFSTHVGGTPGTTYSSQRIRSISWINAHGGTMTVSKNRTPLFPCCLTQIRTSSGSTWTLFPFATGGIYTNNYYVWGGRCDSAKPPVANLSTATVNIGITASATVALPALVVKVTYGGASNYVTPNRIGLRDACDQISTVEVRPGQGPNNLPDTTPGSAWSQLGSMNYPGHPYAPAGDPYTVCVEYDPDGTGPIATRTANATKANTDFANANTLQINLTSTSATACPFTF
jgi:Carboxypeptidase regulatory-like domain